MKPFSCLILTVALFSFGCAHNSTSFLSLSPPVPPLQESELSRSANPERKQMAPEEIALAQSSSQLEAPGAKQGPPATAEVTQGQDKSDSQGLSKDLSDQDLESEKDLDFFEEEGEEVTTMANCNGIKKNCTHFFF